MVMGFPSGCYFSWSPLLWSFGFLQLLQSLKRSKNKGRGSWGQRWVYSPSARGANPLCWGCRERGREGCPSGFSWLGAKAETFDYCFSIFGRPVSAGEFFLVFVGFFVLFFFFLWTLWAATRQFCCGQRVSYVPITEPKWSNGRGEARAEGERRERGCASSPDPPGAAGVMRRGDGLGTGATEEACSERVSRWAMAEARRGVGRSGVRERQERSRGHRVEPGKLFRVPPGGQGMGERGLPALWLPCPAPRGAAASPQGPMCGWGLLQKGEKKNQRPPFPMGHPCQTVLDSPSAPTSLFAAPFL